MRRLLAAGALSVAAAALGARFAERRVLDELESTEPPSWWKTPRFPTGEVHHIPTDDGGVIAAEDAGDPADPAVVLVHGITQNHHDLGLIADVLVQTGFRVIGVDQRGHGESEAGTDGYGAARLGHDLATVLEYFDLDGAILCGHSMGGIAIQSLLTSGHQATHRVHAAVLVATTPATNRPEHRLAGLAAGTRAAEWIEAHREHGRFFTRATFGKRASSAQVDAVLQSSLNCRRETKRDAAQALGSYNVLSSLPSIDLPVFVVYGTRDRVTPPRDNAKIVAATGAHEMVLAGLGHSIPQEDPAAVAQAVRLAATAQR
ncbi:MAG: alpha/beta hydrolase [Acidimicrobiales bacterium]